MATETYNAITLRLVDYSETSQIAVLLTREQGKVSAIAKGAKRQTPSTLAKFSGGMELLSLGEAVVIHRPNSELGNLIEWNLLDAHWHLRSDLRGYRLAMYGADIAHHMLTDHDPHPRSFDALAQLLGGLAEPTQQDTALLTFHWNLIDDLGYRPELDCDVVTGQPLPPDAPTLAFCPRSSGLAADTGAEDRWRIRRQTVKLLLNLKAGGPIDDTPPIDLQRANRLLCSYLRYLLDKHLPTMDAVIGPSRNNR